MTLRSACRSDPAPVQGPAPDGNLATLGKARMMLAPQTEPTESGEGIPHYLAELKDEGFVSDLSARSAELYDLVIGDAGVENSERCPGVVHVTEAMYLYCMMRHLKPEIAIETGVCNGFSSAFLLYALHKNGGGHLYSIDYPEVLGEERDAGAHWEAEENAVVPEGKEPGWLVPEDLRTHWTLILGRSQEELPKLLADLGRVDFFFHDSEHSYECMWFELMEAKKYLAPGGTILAHDVHLNSAFDDFARLYGQTPTVYQLLGSITFA
jgi:predicted O-methyltransferase YrrM